MATAVNVSTYKEVILVLATAGALVPGLRRIKISPVVGFLVTGAIMGPYGLSRLAAHIPYVDYVTISDKSDFPALAELGILLLMFLIGIELSFNRLMTMRKAIFGYGGLQVIGSMALLTWIAQAIGLSVPAALCVGAALSLSSTAIIIEELSLRKKLSTPVGRNAFAILLKQDLMVIPFIILMGLLTNQHSSNVYDELVSALIGGVLAIAVLILMGHFIFKPILRVVVTNSPDMFLAAVLAIVISAGMIASAFGMSMAMGGFAAGLLLSETEYRRMIEGIIEPFKGILLGVFFISVGFEIDPVFIWSHMGTLLLLLAIVVLCKALVIMPAGVLFGLPLVKGIELSLLLGPAGEFAFVLLGLASAGDLLHKEQSTLLISSVALGMALLPLLVHVGGAIDKVFAGRAPALDMTGGGQAPEEGCAIVVGGGRVGGLVAKLLNEHGIQHILVDSNPLVVKRLRSEGQSVYYGEATNADFLKKCGLSVAKTLIVTINDPKKAEEIVALAHWLEPGLCLVVRAHDESHARRLYALGADVVIPETQEAGLQLSEASLLSFDLDVMRVAQVINTTRESLNQALRTR